MWIRANIHIPKGKAHQQKGGQRDDKVHSDLYERQADGFRNRIDFYNWICENRLGKTYGKVKEITCSPYGKESEGGKKK